MGREFLVEFTKYYQNTVLKFSDEQLSNYTVNTIKIILCKTFDLQYNDITLTFVNGDKINLNIILADLQVNVIIAHFCLNIVIDFRNKSLQQFISNENICDCVSITNDLEYSIENNKKIIIEKKLDQIDNTMTNYMNLRNKYLTVLSGFHSSNIVETQPLINDHPIQQTVVKSSKINKANKKQQLKRKKYISVNNTHLENLKSPLMNNNDLNDTNSSTNIDNLTSSVMDDNLNIKNNMSTVTDILNDSKDKTDVKQQLSNNTRKRVKQFANHCLLKDVPLNLSADEIKNN